MPYSLSRRHEKSWKYCVFRIRFKRTRIMRKHSRVCDISVFFFILYIVFIPYSCTDKTKPYTFDYSLWKHYKTLFSPEFFFPRLNFVEFLSHFIYYFFFFSEYMVNYSLNRTNKVWIPRKKKKWNKINRMYTLLTQ